MEEKKEWWGKRRWRKGFNKSTYKKEKKKTVIKMSKIRRKVYKMHIIQWVCCKNLASGLVGFPIAGRTFPDTDQLKKKCLINSA